MANGAGHLVALLGQRRPALQEHRLFQLLTQLPLQAGHLVPRDPAADHRQAAAAVQCIRQIRVRPGQSQGMGHLREMWPQAFGILQALLLDLLLLGLQPLQLLRQIPAHLPGMTAQFLGYRQRLPAGGGQCRLYLVRMLHRAEQQDVEIFLAALEHRQPVAGQAERIAQALTVAGRQRTHPQVQEVMLAVQHGQVDVERREGVQAGAEVAQVPGLFADTPELFVALGAVLPDQGQLRVDGPYLFEFGRLADFGGQALVQSVVFEYLLLPGEAALHQFAVFPRRRIRQVLVDAVLDLRLEHAQFGECQGGGRGLFADYQQTHAAHRKGGEHQATSFAAGAVSSTFARPVATRMSPGSILSRCPRTTARTRRRSRSRSIM